MACDVRSCFSLSLLDFLHTLDATTFNSCPLFEFLNTLPLVNYDLTTPDSGLEAQDIEVARFFLFLAAIFMAFLTELFCLLPPPLPLSLCFDVLDMCSPLMPLQVSQSSILESKQESQMDESVDVDPESSSSAQVRLRSSLPSLCRRRGTNCSMFLRGNFAFSDIVSLSY